MREIAVTGSLLAGMGCVAYGATHAGAGAWILAGLCLASFVGLLRWGA